MTDYDARCWNPCANPNPRRIPYRCGPCHLIWGRTAPSLEDLLAALYEDIRAARPGSTEFYELIQFAKRMVREGASGE